MTRDYEELFDLNVAVGDAERDGNQAFFTERLAPAFAFRRASGAIVTRQEYIDAVVKSPPRKTDIESICFVGKHRALVVCIVSLEGNPTRYHNLRLLVREGEPWKLLAWANEHL